MKAIRGLTGGIVIGSVLLGTISQAQAMGLVRSWTVTAAENDSYSRGYGDGHIAWLPEFVGGGTFVADGEILLEEYDDGSFNLIGDIFAERDTNKKLTIDVWFQEASSAGYGGPKKELKNSAYSSNGGPIDTNTWDYWTFHETKDSTLSADAGYFAGETFYLDDYTNGRYLVQVGEGANGKNTGFGLATWFSYDNQEAGDDRIASTRHADFNLNLEEKEIAIVGGGSEDVPEPAIGLLALGTVGLGALTRRRQ